MLSGFELDLPDTLVGVLDLIADGRGTPAVPLAGGTSLIVDMRARRTMPNAVVWLGKIPELRGIQVTQDHVRLGPCTTVSDILNSDELAGSGVSLVRAAEAFGGQMVRNAATVAGNIACNSPASDLVPPLMALDAEVILESRSGSRTVALDRYFTGYKEDVRRTDELITGISWKRQEESSVDLFHKLARRKGDAITVVGVAVNMAVSDGTCMRARIALGAVAPTVLRAKRAESMLEGETLTPGLIEAAARQATEEASPIDDVRASATYRRHGIQVLTARLLTQAWGRLT
ncbi:MAG: xanthine dehydrogenase family protein subunit M [Actinobacteria bacterium]|nr:xanthine dehydrogenase family protein subunit M [Actinomycetota bacterium]